MTCRPCPTPAAPCPTASRGASLGFIIALVATTSGCGLLIPGLDGEPCPDILCADECTQATGDDGCPVCECSNPEPEPVPCNDDGECGEGQICRHGEAEGEAPGAEDFREPQDGDEAAPAPPEDQPIPGVCVPGGCPDTIPLPACPPNTELVIDFSDDECGVARCRPIDGGDCEGLSPEECEANPDCIGRYYGGGGGCTDGACDPADPLCDPAPCAEDRVAAEYLCVARTDDGCRSGAECPPGEACVTETVCTELCWEDENGGGCTSECWTEGGRCEPSPDSCWDLDPASCEGRADCVLEYEGVPCDCAPGEDCACPDIAMAVCRPRPATQCQSDADCGFGQWCDVAYVCPDCNGDTDLDCAAPCFVEGVCRDGWEPPVGCASDFDCGDGYACEQVTVCEGCAYPEPGPGGEGDAAPPPDEPCSGACWSEGICVPSEPQETCWTDQDCGNGQICNTWDYCAGEVPPDCPNCLVACMGVCEDVYPDDYCYSDDDCGADQFCDTTDCLPDPNCPECDVCAFRCQPREEPPGACLADADCDAGERCATELDVCYCEGDGCLLPVCMSMCVAVDEGQLCYADDYCGNGQTCVYEDPSCDGAGNDPPEGGAPVPACEGRCLSDTDPPVTQCFVDDDCDHLGFGYLCVDDVGCDPNVDFCPRHCEQGACPDVLQPARNPETGSCVVFPSPCDVPAGWELVMSCDDAGNGG